ncbi:ABC transporter substrate-binding protein [Pseudomonas sp. WS 5106]|uniref:ABC transporter substrate-binding protein n=1 Tax=Pseudomonas cremoris TaxID=2724178 RepID=A0A7X1E1K3_9PSED|nr:ABC transporter substrate-binding protein [Pseudomonas cremoris]MBC2382048.1 ABC transporter substrate-binding protein [Pseudomonas cremoris]MBC2408430.1 ABC transporter substrate-binding protein [Pseudomonas cremoris]
MTTLKAFTRTLLLSASLLVGGLGATATQAATPAPVTYGGSTWFSSFPVWVGIDKGIFKKNGLDVKWQLFGTSSSRMSAMVSGNLDFAASSAIPALSLMAAGSKSFEVVSEPDSFVTVQGVFTNGEIKDIASLKGKKIGVTYASSGHILILDLLKQAQMDPNKDVMLLNIPTQEMPAALKTGQIDAAVAWSPTFNILQQQGSTLLADDTQFSLYKQFKIGTGPDILIASRAYTKEHPKEAQAFVDSYMEAIAFIKANPEEAAKSITELTKLPVEEQLKTINAIEWHDLADQKKTLIETQSFQHGLNQLAAFMVENKQLSKVPAVDDWFNTSFVSHAEIRP